MKISHAKDMKGPPVDQGIKKALESISEDFLKEVVKEISVPRHFKAEPDANRRVGDWIASKLKSFGYSVSMQGKYRNVVALPQVPPGEPCVLVGAHYDSVPGTPGADDNASAVAAMLACAGAAARFEKKPNVCFVAFNLEEDNLAGSTDFVKNYLPGSGLQVKQVHILEMVGYSDSEPGSQQVPAGLPIKIPRTGSFLGLVGNRDSYRLLDSVVAGAKSYLPGFPVVGLRVYFGLEKYFPHLGRSDHDPFWKAGLSAIMWTDTAEFRNPNYHQPTDTPDTLHYGFLRRITQLLLLAVLRPLT